MKRKRWIVSKGNKDLASLAAQNLGIDPLCALIATSRGFDTQEKLTEFFEDDGMLTLDPMSIRDMDRAAARIIKALDSFERICVFGDYDADGVTSTALLYSYLESRGADVIRYIPDRISEGYGLNTDAVRELSEKGVKLIVTVDNGVSAVDEIKYAGTLGMDVVVTDHHKVGDELPDCCAVVNPHRADCPSTFKEMSGVGVAFKLICAIEGGGDDELLDEYGELVAIGTIGDVVSLTGENRVMVKRGIANINEHPGVGVASLAQAAGMQNRRFSSSSVAFTLCPRINAAGRMGSADKALELLLCDDMDTAGDLAEEINSMNAGRQSTEVDIYKLAVRLIESDPSIGKRKVIVVSGEGWHQGVIGIVAARITERYGKPSVVISENGEIAKGSARSIEGFSIFEAIEAVSDCLTHYGGHTLAAGVGLRSADISLFREKINEYAANIEMPFAVQKIDCRIQISSISIDLISGLSELEPYGSGNAQPCFGLFGVRIEDITPLSEGKHTRIYVSKNGTTLSTVYFGMPEKSFPYEKGDTVDLAVNLEKNVYNGDERVSVLVRVVRPSVTDEEKVLGAISLYERFSCGEPLSGGEYLSILPERDVQAQVFRSIKKAPLRDGCCEQLCVRLGDDGSNLAKYIAATEIMKEMGVLVTDENGTLRAPDISEKVNLENSPVMRKLREGVK